MNIDKLKIDQEFMDLLPKLADEELEALKNDIVSSGKLRNPILTWNGVIADGHNRYKICCDHNIFFEHEEMQFSDRESVKLWIIKNQLSRRNISSFTRAELALKLKEELACQASKNQLAGVSANSPIGDARETIAGMSGVGSNTISRVEKILAEAPSHIIDKCRSDEMTINKAYKTLKPQGKQEQTISIKKIIKKMDELAEQIHDRESELSDEDRQDLERIVDILDHFRIQPHVANEG